MAFDVPRLQRLAASLGQSTIENLSSLRDLGTSLDIDDAGISVDLWGTWQGEASAPAQIAAPPAKP
jgi:hypothetical protein